MDRKPGYYVYNVIYPMMILTYLAAVAFSNVQQTSRGEKLTISLTVLFTAVAYKFVVASSLPQISYLTELDRFVNLCFVFITALVSEIALFPTLLPYIEPFHDQIVCFLKVYFYWKKDQLNTEDYEEVFAKLYILSFTLINVRWALHLGRRIWNRENLKKKDIKQVKTKN